MFSSQASSSVSALRCWTCHPGFMPGLVGQEVDPHFDRIRTHIGQIERDYFMFSFSDCNKAKKKEELAKLIRQFSTIYNYAGLGKTFTTVILDAVRTYIDEIAKVCDEYYKYFDYDYEMFLASFNEAALKPCARTCARACADGTSTSTSTSVSSAEIWKAIDDAMKYIPQRKDFVLSDGCYDFNRYNYRMKRVEQNLIHYRIRDFMATHFGFSIPTPDTIKSIAKFIGGKSCLEVGAGYGLFGKLLKDVGVNITVTDGRKSHNSIGDARAKAFCDVEEIEAVAAVKKYRDADVLFFVWPPYDTAMAYDAVKAFRGNYVIYGGEFGGCTGDDALHEELRKNWVEEDCVSVRFMPGYSSDCVRLFKRWIPSVFEKDVEKAEGDLNWEMIASTIDAEKVASLRAVLLLKLCTLLTMEPHSSIVGQMMYKYDLSIVKLPVPSPTKVVTLEKAKTVVVDEWTMVKHR